MKVLYIVQNIPLPGRESNDVILTLAEKISAFSEVQFVNPAEYVPWFLRNSEKYRHLYGLEDWLHNNKHVFVYKYWRLPLKKYAFVLLNGISGINRQLSDKIDLNEVDVCHAHYILPDGYLAYLIKKKWGIPYVLSVRVSDLKILGNKSNTNPDFIKAKKVVASASKVIALNARLKEFIESRFDSPCEIIPHGIEEDYISEENINRPQDKVRLISVGAMIERKNHDWTIEFIKNYKGKQDISLELIGDGPELDRLRKLAAGDTRINFTGRVRREEVIVHLKKGDVFVLPSVNETFGLVYLEAAANHNALLGLKNEGVWGVFAENREMLFAADRDQYFIMLEKLVEDRNLREKLQVNAHRKVSGLTWQNIALRYKELYSSIH
mgnify:CR=1 FL=1